ncbi:hypothetical protein FRC01_003936, partial [Tulasnella sp. 417]
ATACEKDHVQGDGTESFDFGTDNKVVIGGREYAKHPSHWYEDGNVGFLVEDAAFFIHRGVISRKSPVIKTLIGSSSLTLLDDAAPPYEQSNLTSSQGVPFVKLGVDDRAIDFARVLDFIYPNELPSAPAPEWPTVDVMGLVRFTNKYLIQDLKTWAVSKLESNHLLVLKDKWIMGTLKATYSHDPRFCVDIIQFSLQCQLSQFLPLAFYALATMEWSDHPPDAALCLDRLSPADRCRLLEGRTASKSEAHIVTTTHGELVHSTMTCTKDQIQKENSELGISTKIIIAGKEYFKHQVHWYEDGNLGFLVEDTAFFIHRGVISRKSAVIKTLIHSSPAITLKDTAPSYEPSYSSPTTGVPFIMLGPGDRATDFARVLDFVYPEVLCSTSDPELTSTELMGLVRLANKYLLQDVKAWAVATLESKHLVVVEDEWVTGTLERRYSQNPGFCVEIIQLSMEYQLPRFLPLAFYALATMEWDDQPEAAVRATDRLSPADRWRVLQGRGTLAKAVKESGSDLYRSLAAEKQCPEGSQDCCDVWSEVQSDLHHWWANLLLHPLEELEHLIVKGESESMCEKCYTGLRAETRGLRDELMGRLTEFFRLE